MCRQRFAEGKDGFPGQGIGVGGVAGAAGAALICAELRVRGGLPLTVPLPPPLPRPGDPRPPRRKPAKGY